MTIPARLSALALIGATIGSLAGCGESDPMSAVHGIQDAVRDSSYLRLEQNAAVEDLLADITPRSIEHVTERYGGESGEVDLAGWTDSYRQALQACVRREALDDETRPCERVDIMLAFAGIRPSEFAGASVVDRTDTVASLALRFANPRLDTTVALRVRAEREGERWRIVRMENLSSVGGWVRRLQDSILHVVNDSIRGQMQGMVKTRSSVARWRQYESSSVYNVRLSVILTNASERPIDRVFVRVGDDVTVGSFPDAVADSDTLPPLAPGDSVDLHESNDVTWTMPCYNYGRSPEICQFEDGDRPEVRVVSIRYEDGSWFGTHDDWYSYAFREERKTRRDEAIDGGGE